MGVLGALASFLAEAGERYRPQMRAPDEEYPDWVYEAAYLNADELGMLAEDAAGPGPGHESGVEYVSIAYQDGTDADEALAVLERQGPAAVVAHLARWDLGQESELAARAYGHVSPTPVAGRDDHTYADGRHVLTWDLDLGSVGLARKVARTPGAVEPGRSPQPPATAVGPARRALPLVGQSSRRPRHRERPEMGL